MKAFDKIKDKVKNFWKNITNRKTMAEQLPSGEITGGRKDEQQLSSIKYTALSENFLQIEFYDPNSKHENGYDTTRLVINKNIMRNMPGDSVCDCHVSWYGSSDAVYTDTPNAITGQPESKRAQLYSRVLAEIDLESIQRDPNYCSEVMKSLLDQERVKKYLENGMKNSPEHPCGNYIGGIQNTEKGFTKVFNQEVGTASHYSPYMVNSRQQQAARQQAEIQRQIAEKKADIEKLQRESNDYER